MARKKAKHPSTTLALIAKRAAERIVKERAQKWRIIWHMRNGERRWSHGGSSLQEAREHVRIVFEADTDDEYQSALIRQVS